MSKVLPCRHKGRSAATAKSPKNITMSALALNAKHHVEGINKDNVGNIAHIEILFNEESVLTWHWLEVPVVAKGTVAMAKEAVEWFKVFPVRFSVLDSLLVSAHFVRFS